MSGNEDKKEVLTLEDLELLAAMKLSGESPGPDFLKKIAGILLEMRENLADEKAKNRDLLSTLRHTLKIDPSSEKSSRKPSRPKLSGPAPSEAPAKDPESAESNLPKKGKKGKEDEESKRFKRVMRRLSSALRAAERARVAKRKSEKEAQKSTYDPDEYDLSVFDDRECTDEFFEGMPADFGRVDDSDEEKYNQSVVDAAQLGTERGADPEFSRAPEAVLGEPIASCHKETKDFRVDPAAIPPGCEKGLRRDIDTTTRTDLDIRVSQINISIESVVHPETGFRARANTEALGPADHGVTWRAIVNSIMLVVGYAFPLRRLERLTGGELSASRVCKYLEKTAQKALPIYLFMLDRLANSSVLGADSAVARVSQWTRILEAGMLPNDFLSEGLSGELNRVVPFLSRTAASAAPKTRLHTTILTGRTEAKNPNSLLVVYRTHAGDVGNILNAILPRRTRRKTARRSEKRFHWRTCRRLARRLKPLAPLVVQGDLSPANHASDKAVLARIPITYAGCLAHLRRPFVRYRDQDPELCDRVVDLIDSVFDFERHLDKVGRNRKNVRAIRLGFEGTILWVIRKFVEPQLERWSSARPLGRAIRYLIKNWESLTAYLRDPRLEATNNLREKLLRYEKLMDSSSFGRDTIEGRARYDILRSLLATCTTAGVDARQYFLFLLLAQEDAIKSAPQNFTPLAYAQHLQLSGDSLSCEQKIFASLAKKSVAYLNI